VTELSAEREALIERLEPFAAAARGLEGWGLEYEPEPLTEGPPWDYEAMARTLAADAQRVLDLGTGGGEVLERVLSASAASVVATEEWHVNAPVAAARLRPRAQVVRTSSLALPFAAGSFDLILSRHEEIEPREIARLLADGGHILTQQVLSETLHELRAYFPNMTRFPDHFAEYQRGLAACGLQIEVAQEFRRGVRFRELGHLVYNLVAAPWSFPEFGVRSHVNALAEIDLLYRNGQAPILTDGFYLLQVSSKGG